MPTELAVSDVIGRLIEFWGFKRNMGRVWSVLYLSPDPLTADDLRQVLQLSSGAVSMTLSELSRWGVVRKVWIQGERKDFYAAEVQLWRMISRVFNERERSEIVAAIDAFEEALVSLERTKKTSTDAAVRARAELQHERITQLLKLAKIGKGLLDALLSTAKIDADKENRAIQDGEVVTACQQACPASAITFGNLNDKTSKVAGLARDERTYSVLADLNTRPRTTYLAAVMNPNPELAEVVEEHVPGKG